VKLEVISRQPKKPSHRPPILLVHGAWHGAWCWQGNFLEFFADRGWETHALSLRGHGKSFGKDRIRWWSIDDYVNDVQEAVVGLESEPVIIGHSMGGFVTQKYLETHSAKAAVLLASVPISGTGRFILRIARKHPIVALQVFLSLSTYPIMKNPQHAREWLLSASVSKSDLADLHAQLQDEAFRASLDLLLLNLPRPHLVKTPIAVLGAANDAIFSNAEVQRTAGAYGVQATIFPNMAHNMMIEPGWQDVAAWIDHWAGSTVGVAE